MLAVIPYKTFPLITIGPFELRTFGLMVGLGVLVGAYVAARFIEDHTAEVDGRPLGCLHLITFNSDGQTQHIGAHYRPRSSGMLFSRLLRERLAGTSYAEHFLAGEA